MTVTGNRNLGALVNNQAGNVFFDPTGKASAGIALCDDDFSLGMRGWTQLFTPDSDQATAPDNGNRIVAPLTRISRSGTNRIALRSPGIAESTATPLQCMGIKRMHNMYGDGRYLMEMVISVEAAVSQLDRPVDFGWGLDTALDDGTRRFFKVRYWNYSETLTAAQNKFQLKTGTGSSDANYTDIAGGSLQFIALNNENKALPFYLALEVNTATGKYLGFRLGNLIKVGSLAATPDNTLSDLVVASESLPTFAGGVNSAFDIANRTSASRTQAQSNVHWHRLSYLGV